MNHSQATENYAAYINAPRQFFSHDQVEQEMFDEDTTRARAAMERAWLKEKPVVSDD